MTQSSYALGAAGLMLCLGACGSGGGNEVSSTPPPVPISPAELPNPMPRPVTKASGENFDTTEYRNSSAAVGSNAIGAWQQGATGKGVTIGFVDTGLVPSLPDFAGRIHPSSRDVEGSRPMGDVYGHGTAVAGIAAAARDNDGMQGIAFEAQIFMAKADQGCPSNCSFQPDAIADGIDAARAAGARVINLSIGGDGNSDVWAAAQRALNAGIIIVIGAGNSGSAPSGMARHLAGMAPGQVIIVGGLGVSNPDGTINYDVPATYTTLAGSSQSSFLTAPGWLNSATYFQGGVDRLSGTSFAAPVVTGAVALLAQAFPMLTPQQIVLLLHRTADDLGATGTDSTFGRGRLNIGRAFQPVGMARLANTMTALPTSLGTLPSAAGDAARQGSLRATILDDFMRPFDMNLAATMDLLAEPGPLARSMAGSQRSGTGRAGPVKLAFLVEDRAFHEPSFKGLALSPQEAQSARLLATTAIARLTGNSRIGLGFGSSASSLRNQLSRHSGPAFLLSDAASARAGFDARRPTAVVVEQKSGRWTLVAAAERGSVPAHRREQRDSQYALFSIGAERDLGQTHLSIGLTHMVERETLLGGRLNDFLGEPGARTWFADFGIDQQFGEGWSLSGSYRRGWTSFSGRPLATSAFSIDLMKAHLFSTADALAFRLSQPLRVERGGISMILPVSWDYRTGQATEARRTMSLAPSGRELFQELGYLRSFAGGSASLHLFRRSDPGHSRQNGNDVGAAVRANIIF